MEPCFGFPFYSTFDCLYIRFQIITSIVLLGNDSLGKTTGVSYFCSARSTLIASQGSRPVRSMKSQHQCPGSRPGPRALLMGRSILLPSQESGKVTALTLSGVVQRRNRPGRVLSYGGQKALLTFFVFLFCIKSQQASLNDTSNHFLFGI